MCFFQESDVGYRYTDPKAKKEKRCIMYVSKRNTKREISEFLNYASKIWRKNVQFRLE